MENAIDKLIENQRMDVSENKVEKIGILLKALDIVATKLGVDIKDYKEKILKNSINDVNKIPNNMNRVVLM